MLLLWQEDMVKALWREGFLQGYGYRRTHQV
jgi:hypothetical protein